MEVMIDRRMSMFAATPREFSRISCEKPAPEDHSGYLECVDNTDVRNEVTPLYVSPDICWWRIERSSVINARTTSSAT